MITIARYPFDADMGPQNDALIREHLTDALRGCADLDSRDVDVYVANGEATLLGVVNSLEDARLAQSIAEHCPGVGTVYNQLRLARVYLDYAGDGLGMESVMEYDAGRDVM
jgi:osmotically-inducible protein OsmY